MRRLFLSLVLAMTFVLNPALEAKKKPELTPMELQAIQSKEFETSKDLAFAAVMTVIQDLGYTVQTADLGSGFITAASPTENKTGFFEAIGGVSASGNTMLTAFIMQMPSGLTRIRLNFVNSKNQSSTYGQQARKDKPILDPLVYQTAWDKVDEALFVLGALNSSSPVKAKASGSSEAPNDDKLIESAPSEETPKQDQGQSAGADPAAISNNQPK